MTTPLPPRVPDDLPALDRLITLLGNRTKGPLGPGPTRELTRLAGAYPDPTTAARWKSELKDLRRQLVAEHDDDHDATLP
jgi:hypothetical protein